jgi:type I restriction enzyme R subunit
MTKLPLDSPCESAVGTHHKLKRQGDSSLTLGEADGEYKLDPMTEPGTGQVQDKEKIKLSAIVQKVNDLFEGELTEDDKLVYVNNVLMGKLLESDLLMQQAANNSKEQFANSPDLSTELMNAIMDAFEAHSTMSKQAIDSDKVRQGLKHILLGPAELYEALRSKWTSRSTSI